MRSKRFNALFKGFMLPAIVLFLAFAVRGVYANADSGETVRVSTSKELSAALKNADTGTIIFRTQAYISVTIKQNKAAAEKFLIIDAPNASITNKALFAGINILSAKSYTESVSGNNISFSDVIIPDGFTVAKKKQVESLTIFNSYGYFDTDYILRKSAKIKDITLIFSGYEAPVESTYNSKKRQIDIKFDFYGSNRSIKLTFDKSGRKIREVSDGDYADDKYDYTYSYDSNGNVIKTEGSQNMGGKFTAVRVYSGNLFRKSEYKDEYSSGATEFTYDENGRVTGSVYNGVDSIDGQAFDVKSTETFKYDSKGRLIYETISDEGSGYFSEVSYTYNSKGFLTKKYINSSGSETVFTYKYNKAGDLITEKWVSDGHSETRKYQYDEFGNSLE